ncbi:MAG: hypothetical protein EPN84_03030 [Legionella sp.]|nr:MAG: hypothetical protein EPN84_03030 [Legionella sp.]
MNKCLLIAAGSLLAMSAQAQQSWCGFKDYFRINDENHPNVFIVSGASDADIVLQSVGPKSFLLLDNGQCTSGFAHVTIGYDANHYCVLDIKDGPWMMHPSVKASCNGLNYIGTRYDGIGSFSYSIDLD